MKTYVIKKGDSLSKIAAAHGFASWEPLWNFNTLVQDRLKSKDPNRIDIGVEIVIPRSKKEYETAIANLERLLGELGGEMESLKNDLLEAKREADTVGRNIDLASDLLMISKGAVKASVKLGSKRLLMYKLKKSTLDAIQTTARSVSEGSNEAQNLVLEKLGRTAVDHSIMTMATGRIDSKKVASTFKKEMTHGVVRKSSEGAARMLAPAEHAHAIADIVGILTDFALKGANALEAIKPSAVAKMLIWATDEHPDFAFDRANRQIEEQNLRSKKRLQEAIGKLRGELQKVYGN